MFTSFSPSPVTTAGASGGTCLTSNSPPSAASLLAFSSFLRRKKPHCGMYFVSWVYGEKGRTSKTYQIITRPQLYTNTQGVPRPQSYTNTQGVPRPLSYTNTQGVTQGDPFLKPSDHFPKELWWGNGQLS